MNATAAGSLDEVAPQTGQPSGTRSDAAHPNAVLSTASPCGDPTWRHALPMSDAGFVSRLGPAGVVRSGPRP